MFEGILLIDFFDRWVGALTRFIIGSTHMDSDELAGYLNPRCWIHHI
jgi:hypothetical protein